MDFFVRILTGPELVHDKNLMAQVKELQPDLTPQQIALMGWPDTSFITAFSKGRFSKLLGFVEVNFSGDKHLELANVQIQAKHRNGVLFRTFLKELLYWMRAKKIISATSKVQTSNKKMISMLERLGFEIAPTEVEHTLRAHGNGPNIIASMLAKRILKQAQSARAKLY